MVTRLRDAGGDVEGFAARQLTAGLIRDASLILTATRAHRAWVVEEVPAAVRRTFTLLEFARIVGSLEEPDGPDQASLASFVALAARHRAPEEAPGADDVPDPYGRDDDAFARAHTLISGAVDRISVRLNGVRLGGGGPSPAGSSRRQRPPSRRSATSSPSS